MPFDPLTWFIGASLTESSKRLLSRLEARRLNDRLRETISDWRATLTEDLRLTPDALFPAITAPDESFFHNRPALLRLRSLLTMSHAPATTIWLDALEEHWAYRRTELGADAHPFFLQPPETAKSQLEALAGRLDGVCKQDQELFRGTTVDLLRTLVEEGQDKNMPSLRVVDISADDTDCPTKLDIKVRNTAAEPCFVRAVEIDVLQVGVLYTWYRPSLQPVTAEYDVDLDPREAPVPYVIDAVVSQAVAPQGTDRFVLRVAYPPDFDWFVHEVLVHATVRLVYNEDGPTTEPVPLRFTVRPRWRLRAMRTEPIGVSGPKLVANRRALDAMLAASGKVSPRIEALQAAVERGEWPDAANPDRTVGEAPSHLRIRFGTLPPPSTAKQRVFRR